MKNSYEMKHIEIPNIKPKLLFFQYKYDNNLPKFLLAHKNDHVRCLKQFFDVTVINEDCDYQQICDIYNPDLSLFESGIDNITCKKPKITNSHTCPEIPKLGLHNADPFSGARAGFLSDMDHLGIETYFAIATTAAENTKEIAPNLFVWPNFVDSQIYKDYGEWKSIPVLFTGNTNMAMYPWRKKILRIVSQHYPSLICPHPGYNPRSSVVQVIVGERYARTINAASIVPTCGTVAKEVVRKHFEVPACRACLLTEKSSSLDAAGFIDMQNCVYVDEHNVLDKIAYLFHNPGELQRITDSGYELTHSHHTLKQRDQIYQWLLLYKQLQPGKTIIQANPFGNLAIVNNTDKYKHFYVIANGDHLILARLANEKLQKHKYEEAEKLYLKCLNYMPWLPEAKLGLTICNLYKGKASVARSWIGTSIFYILREYKAIDPDPVEWAYYIISLLCLGNRQDAFQCANQFPWLHHPELDRVRWIANIFEKKACDNPFFFEANSRQRATFHRLPNRSLDEWIRQILLMLKACRQSDLVEILENACFSESKFPHGYHQTSHFEKPLHLSLESTSADKKSQMEPHVATGKSTADFSKRQFYTQKAKLKFRHLTANILHNLEVRFGYFLPYHLSKKKEDEFFQKVQDLAKNEKLKTVLIIGGAKGQGCTDSLLTGITQNVNSPKVFCTSNSKYNIFSLWHHMASDDRTKWYILSTKFLDKYIGELETLILTIKRRNDVAFFDLILIDGSEIQNSLHFSDQLNAEVDAANFILLDDINTNNTYNTYHRLLNNPNFGLIVSNPNIRNGYSIFKKISE